MVGVSLVLNAFMTLARTEVRACRRGERRKGVMPIWVFGS